MGKLKIEHLSQKEVRDIETKFLEYYSFISEITQLIPRVSNQDDDNEVSQDAESKSVRLPLRLCPARSGEKKPARTVEELQAKLSLLKGKTSLPYKEKLQKKGLKSRLKKREKKERRKVKRLEAKIQSKSDKSQNGEVNKKTSVKPIYNNDGDLVFSKFDFSELGAKSDKKPVKVIKDAAVALKKVKEQQKHMKTLEEQGLKEKVTEIREKKAWKNALLKTEGVKLKDDPELLKATIKKVKKRKEKSEARWKANQKRVEKEKEEKQRKRTENLQARSKDKKMKKLRTMAKRGRVIAGF